MFDYIYNYEQECEEEEGKKEEEGEEYQLNSWRSNWSESLSYARRMGGGFSRVREQSHRRG